MATRLISPPESEPVTLDEAKLHCRVEHNAEDTLIQSFITAARSQCEHILGRSIMPQTWEKTLHCFPGDGIGLHYPTIISITSIKYIDAITGTEVTLAANQYVLDKDSEPGWVMPAPGVGWPATLDVANAVRVRYQAGYADAASVPEAIKNWIKLAVGAWYKNRESSAEASITPLPKELTDGLLDRYRIWQL